jgi:glycosyltransferase involved in cell wall biosynthesis
MNIIVSAKMNPGNFEPKFYPLIELDEVSNIYVVRKEIGPKMKKVQYIILPWICKYSLFNLIITPILLLYHTWTLKVNLILSYHIIPHAFFAAFAGFVANKPYIIAQTGNKIELYSHKSKLFFYLVKIIIDKSEYFNVPGNSTKEFWAKKGINNDKINVLHSVINTEKFKPNLELNASKFDFIFIGRLVKLKRVDLIIDSFSNVVKKFPNSSLKIVGQGPELYILKKKVKKYNLESNVNFQGYSRDINRLLNCAKIFVMASESEGLPVAMMEAMACELLVVMPDITNISQTVIHGETGILHHNTVDDLTEKMLYSLSNYKKFDHIRKNARYKILNDHSIESAKVKWEKVFQTL